jgi:hypothetical protein
MLRVKRKRRRLRAKKLLENVPGRNCNQKITKWVDIQICSDVQDRLIQKNYNEACPIYTEPLDDEKTT